MNGEMHPEGFELLDLQAQSPLRLDQLGDPRSPEYQAAIRMTPATFAFARTRGEWVPANHLLFVAHKVAQELIQGDARILFMMPPRHGKSELLSYHTSLWWLDLFPYTTTMLITYGADLSQDFGRRVRDAIENNPDDFNVRIRPDVRRTEFFMTTEGGGMASVGIGGPITGRGAHLLMLDDYIKNLQEAQSKAVMDFHWDWFTTTAYTRLEPGGNLVALATRWDYNDLLGRLERTRHKLGGRWIVIRLPALAGKDDPLNRVPGEALWPERYNREALLERKSLLGTYWFSALYDQNPIKKEEAKADVDQIRVVDILPHAATLRWVRSWDLASTQVDSPRKRKGDHTVGILQGVEGRPGSSTSLTYVSDMKRGRWNASRVEEILRSTAASDGVTVPIVLEQEPGAAGKAYAQHLARNVLRGYNVVIVPTANEAGKWSQAQPFIAAIGDGRFLMRRALWNKLVTDELQDFPDGTYDDIVDAISRGYNYIHQIRVSGPTWGRFVRPTERQVSAVEKTRGATFGRR